MFDTPNWMGSFITSRSNKDINELNRKHEVIMEDIKHKHEYLIQESRNRSNEDIARANRESSETISRLNREHEAAIAEAKNKNAISVALIQAASNATGKAMPYVLPAFLAGRASNRNDNNSNKSNGKPTISTPVVTVTKAEAKAETNRKKADDLFPELEPTFGVTLMNGTELLSKTNNVLPKVNITQFVPAVGAVLSMAAPLLAIL